VRHRRPACITGKQEDARNRETTALSESIIVPEHELERFCTGDGWPGRVAALLRQQRSTWDMLRNGYAGLEQVRTRVLPFDGIRIEIQYNPGRITSASAKVDPKSIRDRKCFLCPANLPPEQRGLVLEGDYLLLCNPFPILPEHFTIPHRAHVPQRIGQAFGAFLSMSRSLGPDDSVFYNGPACGASAPDHLHFQAGTAGFMPIEHELDSLKTRFGRPLADTCGLRAWAIEDPLRRFAATGGSAGAGISAGMTKCSSPFAGMAGFTTGSFFLVIAVLLVRPTEDFEKGRTGDRRFQSETPLFFGQLR
jgi:hypothetical protein